MIAPAIRSPCAFRRALAELKAFPSFRFLKLISNALFYFHYVIGNILSCERDGRCKREWGWTINFPIRSSSP